jgi:two-component system LytT family sensor kinase
MAAGRIIFMNAASPGSTSSNSAEAPLSGTNPGAGSQRKTLLFWILQGTGWLAFGAMMFLWGLAYWSALDALANKAILIAVGFVLTLFFRALYRRARSRVARRWASLVLVGAILASFAGGVVWLETELALFQVYYALTRGESLALEFPAISFGMVLYLSFVLLAWSLLYFGINAWREAELQKERAVRAELLAQKARLRALRSQLEPHFLFNTLNAISTLVTEGRNSEAGRMISRLSDFLRLTLQTEDLAEISVAEELEFARRYLEIEQVRFGDRLRTRIHASADVMDAIVPALILQPLVENAVKHGVLAREDGGSITITAERNDGWLLLAVGDDGPGLPQSPAPRRGVGLANTAARLRELYGDAGRFAVEPGEHRGLVARIAIPVQQKTGRQAGAEQIPPLSRPRGAGS